MVLTVNLEWDVEGILIVGCKEDQYLSLRFFVVAYWHVKFAHIFRDATGPGTLSYIPPISSKTQRKGLSRHLVVSKRVLHLCR